MTMTDEMMDELDNFRCLDEGDDCSGHVEYRMAMSPTGISYPRCDGHYSKRLDTQEGIVSRYGGQMDYTGWDSFDERYDD